MEPVLKELARQYPVVTVTGPRQSGKTTLCRKVFKTKEYVNLEAPDTRLFAREDPRGFLAQFSKGVILDEIQRVPDLLSYIQPMVDQKKGPGQFILTGSQQLEVLNTVSQSLAGRTALLKLLPLSMVELGKKHLPSSLDLLLLTGFYPRIYDQGLNPTRTLGDYVATYVERDLRQLEAIRDLSLFEKFLRLCAGRVGQLLNLQNLASDAGISHTTARTWLTLLEASYIVFLLPPWFANVSRRLIKSPKLFFYDIGLASFLLGIETEQQMKRDPLRGNLFENLVVIEFLKYRWNRGLRSNLHFFRDAKGNEVDLLYGVGAEWAPVEIKSGATIAPDYFKGLRSFAGVAKGNNPGGAVVYGGNQKQLRSDCLVFPATRIEELIHILEEKYSR